MRKFFLILALLLISLTVRAVDNQKYLSYFSAYILQSANTAINDNSLSKDEKDVILWTNLVRIDPSNFSIMLQQYIRDHSEFQWKNPYVQSLMIDLKNSPVLNTLTTTNLLNSNATNHAIYSKATLRRGHDNFDQRAELAFNQKYTAYGENCAYFVRDALHSVVCLLIDENVTDLGHRKIILNNNYNEIGVSVQPYVNNQYKVVVQEFGTSENPPYYATTVYSPPIVQSSIMTTPAPENVIAKNNSNIQEMFINGKYVKVDTSKYYTWNEYQQYVKNAQRLKSKKP
jgi:uncharacterized protein YkwD